MDLYLTMALIQQNRQLLGLDSTYTWVSKEMKNNESMLSYNRVTSYLPRMPPFIDLFKMLRAKSPAFEDSDDIIEAKVVLSLMIVINFSLNDLHDSCRNILQYRETSDSNHKAGSES